MDFYYKVSSLLLNLSWTLMCCRENSQKPWKITKWNGQLVIWWMKKLKHKWKLLKAFTVIFNWSSLVGCRIIEYSPSEKVNMKYSPTKSVEVGRSSRYKSVLKPNRRSIGVWKFQNAYCYSLLSNWLINNLI